MSFYLVVYTAAHLIGAVSPPVDLDQCAYLEDHYTEGRSMSDDPYTFACEEHDKQPKVQIRIKAEDRRFYEDYCISNGLACHQRPNGDIEQKGYRCYTVYRNYDTPRPKIVKDTCGIAATLKKLTSSFNRADREFLSLAEESCAAGEGALPTMSMAHRYAEFRKRHPGPDALCGELLLYFKYSKKGK